MKNFIKLLTIVLIVSNVNSCKSSKNVVKTVDKEVEILIELMYLESILLFHQIIQNCH